MFPSDPVGPLFFWDPLDLTVFFDVKEAEEYLEVPDVRSGRASCAYDSLGRRLLVEVHSRPKSSILGSLLDETVHVSLTDRETRHSEELREILVKFLSATGRLGESTLRGAEMVHLVGWAIELGATNERSRRRMIEAWTSRTLDAVDKT